MKVFIDTSAFFAILDADDKYHQKAKVTWVELISSGILLALFYCSFMPPKT